MSAIEEAISALQRDVDRLQSREQIVQQLARYGRGHEWGDAAMLDAVFFDDAMVDLGFFKGRWKDYLPGLLDHTQEVANSLHVCGIPQIAFEGDDRAHAECYSIAGGRTKALPGLTTVVGGRLFFTFERRNAFWKATNATYALEWQLDQERSGDAIVEPHPGMNMIIDRSPRHPLYRVMGPDVT